ncbi:MAG TPA: cysteine desulfurase family protein [Acidimicrobiales bacterium]|nr:cysteine desulfurase family protein [Acidimicrobiales bacterium]
MTSGRHYLDHASTTPIRPEARRAMVQWLEEAGSPGGVGDPGRVHEEGCKARAAVESARETVARFVGADPSRLVFTSGATEAANTAVESAICARPGKPVVCAGVEHSCVREACARAGKVVETPVDARGRLDVARLTELLEQERPGLVNCQLANHEVGTLQPVTEVVEVCHRAGALVHCDAAAAVGHVPVSFRQLGVDLMSVSAHKLGGPPGIGALVVRRGVRLTPLLVGGSEERARRAGGENVLGIVGFAAACEALQPGALGREAAVATKQTGELVAAAMAVADVEVLGDAAHRLPHIVCVSVGGVLGEAVLLSLDRAGIAAHSGSACSSEVLEPSPVLAAMGVDPDRSLRLSVGWSTTDEDVSAFVAAFPAAVARLRSLASG